MIEAAAIVDLIKSRLNRVLLVAEAALPQPQYLAYRKLILDEFGQSLQRDLDRLYQQDKGKDRHG